ncbi:GNAT family N-acetyltransferase [Paenibacillus sp. LMG 31456]|uniref:GNAT family N-acetyltransferase n=1 Tax=Paenibacillus foliorum TaxID=2654974 RepID=A0A972K2U7_9BACL|nr:GNAT family N-acetyltransferase [Paenibacillus foliorum]NOU94237.1 GNAT family N-acetyltransferase [Paenibacillus foliorum]
MNDIEIKIVKPDYPDLLQLIHQLDEELLERYPAEEVHGIDFEDPSINDVVFIVVYRNNRAVGCGAIRPLDASCTELKRFFVDRTYRKMGIASRMLSFLENEARLLHFEMIRLETGTEQPESVQLYQKHGYLSIEKFGPYVDGEMSLCFEKRL